MPLNIISNAAANTAHRNLASSDAQAAGSVAKLSAGSRVLGAKDDAAALAIGSRLRAEVAAMEQASVNAGQAVSMLQIADGAMSQINDVMIRMKSLSVQAGSDQLGATERSLINTEFQQLLQEVERISNDTEFNGQSLIKGVTGGTAAFASNGGTNLATAIAQANGISTFTFDAASDVASYSVTNDGTNLIVTNLETSTQSTAALPTTLPAAGATSDIRFDDIGLTVTIDENFDASATALLVDGANATVLNNVTSQLATFNGVESVQIATGNAASSYSVIANGDGTITATNLASGTAQSLTVSAAPATGETQRLNFSDIGVVVTINDSFDTALNTSLIEASDVIGAATAVVGTNGIVSISAAAGNTADNLQLDFDTSSKTFTLTNLVTSASDSVQVLTPPSTGDVSYHDFTIGGETFTLALDDTFTGLTAITSGAVTAAAGEFTVAGATGTGITDITLTSATGDISRITGAITIAGTTAVTTAITLASDDGDFTLTAAVDFTTGTTRSLTLTNTTTSATVTLTITDDITATGAIASGDFSAAFDNVVVTTGRATNEGIVQSYGTTAGRVSNVQIERIRGDISSLDTQNLVFDIPTAGDSSAGVTVTLGTTFSTTVGDLDALGTGSKILTLTDANGNEVDVSFDIDTAFATDTVDLSVDFSDYLEDVVSRELAFSGSTVAVDATAVTDVSGDALTTIDFVSSTGDISQINGLLTVSEADAGASVTFSLASSDGNFTADVDLTTAGTTTTPTSVTLTNASTGATVTLDVVHDAIDQAITATTVNISSLFKRDVGPTELPNAIVAGGAGALTNITVETVTGSIDTVDASRIVLSNLTNASDITFTLASTDGNDFVAQNVSLATSIQNTEVTLSDGQGNSIKLQFDVTAFSGAEVQAEVDIGAYLGNVVASTGAASTIGASDFTFKIGTGNESFDRVTLSLDAVTTQALGLAGLDVTTAANADSSSTALDAGITTLNRARSNVGAFQNRLEVAASNLATARENTEAARSALLDLDVAAEMTKFTSRQILVQAGVSMLAQANQLPQNLLRLLQ